MERDHLDVRRRRIGLTRPLSERFYAELGLTLRLSPAGGTPSRTRARFQRPRLATRTVPFRRERPDLRRELRRPPRRIRAVGRRDAEVLIDLARESMVTRSRDLYSFAAADPRDVRLVDCGHGLELACIGVVPEFRLLLEAVYSFLLLQNGVPIGYALASALFRSSEVAYNVFESFRGGEAAHVYGRLLAAVRALFGVDTLEFVAAVTRDEIGGGVHAQKTPRRLAELQIARFVAEGVVDYLEIVDVQQKQGERTQRGAGRREHAVEYFGKMQTIGQSRQGIDTAAAQMVFSARFRSEISCIVSQVRASAVDATAVLHRTVQVVWSARRMSHSRAAGASSSPHRDGVSSPFERRRISSIWRPCRSVSVVPVRRAHPDARERLHGLVLIGTTAGPMFDAVRLRVAWWKSRAWLIGVGPLFPLWDSPRVTRALHRLLNRGAPEAHPVAFQTLAHHDDIRRALPELRNGPFHFCPQGSKIIYVEENGYKP